MISITVFYVLRWKCLLHKINKGFCLLIPGVQPAGEGLLPFFEIWKKCPDFEKKLPVVEEILIEVLWFQETYAALKTLGCVSGYAIILYHYKLMSEYLFEVNKKGTRINYIEVVPVSLQSNLSSYVPIGIQVSTLTCNCCKIFNVCLTILGRLFEFLYDNFIL